MIGSWIRRKGRKWHLVESVIADAAITRCGRRLEPRDTDERSDVEPLTRAIGQPQLCAGGCGSFRAVKEAGEGRLTL